MDTPISLSQMFIQSYDTLREISIDQRIPSTWNERPPLITGPKNQPETTALLKGVIRKGVPPALRCAVWLSNIIQAVHPHQDSHYWHEYRTLQKARALDSAYENLHMEPSSTAPTFGQVHPTAVEGTTPDGQQAVNRVVIACQHILGFEYAPLLPTLAALLLTTMSESYTFCALREMSHDATRYFPTSQREYLSVERAFADILFKLHPQTAEYLEDRGVLDNLRPIFQDCFLNILPIHLVQRVMDIYTLEGLKVLFRIGISLFVLFKRESSEQLLTISNADEWWQCLKHWTHHPQFNFDVVVRKAYGIHGRGFRKQMRFPKRSILRRIIKMEEERLLEEGMEAGDWEEAPSSPLGLVPCLETVNEEPVKPVLLVHPEARLHLARWIPLSMRLTNVSLLYSTNYHGRSLEMLYSRVKHAKHTVTVMEVLSSSYVIGMYASQAWRISNQVYGDGECFLFRLSPEAQQWKWRPDPDETQLLQDMEDNKQTALLEQFMVGTKGYISMGGNRDGSSGLRLNDELTIGESSPAEGFHNEPLHGLGQGSVFQIGLLEVYGLVSQIDGRPV